MKAFPILTLFLLPAIALSQANKGGLKVFIENAEEDDLIGVIVQVINEDLVTAGTTDSSGFLYLPNIDEGDYSVLTMHVATKAGRDTFQLSIESGTVCTLRVRLELFPPLRDTLIFEQAPSSQVSHKGGLKIFIENAEEDDIIAATVQVMDDGLQVAEGVTDFLGFVYLPNISEGEFDVVIRHISVKSDTFPVNVQHGTICTLQVNLELRYGLLNSGGIGCKLLIEPLNDSVLLKQGTTDKGGLKVFIENAEQDDIVAATVQVMDGEKQVTGGVTDFVGFLYIPAINPGTYTVVFSHNLMGRLNYEVDISPDSIYELRIEPDVRDTLRHLCYPSLPIFDTDPFSTTRSSGDILQNPNIYRN